MVCWTFQQHASVFYGWIYSDNCTGYHTETATEAEDQICYHTQSQYTVTGLISPSADPVTPGAWQGCHWSTNSKVTGMDRLVGLVVRRPPRERKIPGSNPACAGIFSGSSHTSDSKIDTPVATLPDAWRYRVSAGTGRPDVSVLWLGEVESLICNFYLSVAARKIVWADPSLRYTRMLLGR